MRQVRSINGGAVKVRLDTDKLEDVRSALLSRYRTQIGILGAKNSRAAKVEGETHSQYKERAEKWKYKGQAADITNAEIGLKHEFGSYSERIPPRSFLMVPLTKNQKELMDVRKILWKSFEKAEVSLKKAYTELGVIAEQIVQRAFETSNDADWDKNSDATIALKGSEKPLIDTAQLRRSIMSKVVLK